MKYPLRTLNFYCIIIGMLLLVQGLYNLIDPPFLEVFTANSAHAVIQTVLGIAGIWTGLRGGTNVYAIFLGTFLLLVGLLYFISMTRMYVVDLLNINAPVAWLYLLFGVVSLLVVYLGKKLAARFSVQ